MENAEDEDWNDETEINPEVWLQALLAMTGDKQRKAKLVHAMAEKSGHTLEQVEEVLAATINFLSEKARSN